MTDPKISEMLEKGAKLYAGGHTAAAAQVYREALKLAPQDPTVRLRHAIAIWHGEDRAEEALTEIRALGRQYPQATIFAHEGLILNSLGRFDEGAAAARKAVQVDPGYSSAWLDLATAVNASEADDLADELRAMLAKDPEPKVARDLNYALATVLRKLGDDDGAFDATGEGNRLSPMRWDAPRERAMQDLLRSVFDAGLMERLRGHGLADERPVFITGMPRSGTTLLDRMLAAHPVIASVGETTTVGMIFNQFLAQAGREPARLKQVLTPKVLGQIARAVLKGITDRAGQQPAARIIDKMPPNTLFWPLIACMFPNGRILHMQRHPLGTCLSCWEASFAFGLDYATDMTALGQAWRQYADLTDDWRALVGAQVHPVLYEDLVTDAEPVLRGVLNHLGLPWDARCLTPDRSGPVKTASVAQVRAPVSSGSVARWRDYRERLQPVVDAMGGDDWLAARWRAIQAECRAPRAE
ncbi:MAG: sulfotransferase [Pseudomonadota bacterium]